MATLTTVPTFSIFGCYSHGGGLPGFEVETNQLESIRDLFARFAKDIPYQRGTITTSICDPNSINPKDRCHIRAEFSMGELVKTTDDKANQLLSLPVSENMTVNWMINVNDRSYRQFSSDTDSKK